MSVVKLPNDESAVASLRAFLRAVEGLFVPPLRERVDLNVYPLKLLGEGHVFACSQPGHRGLAAAACVYCDPGRFDRAFIPFIATLVRGQGLGGKVLDVCVEYCKAAGTQGIDTQTWEGNSASIGLFQSRGFVQRGMSANRHGGRMSVLLGLDFP